MNEPFNWDVIPTEYVEVTGAGNADLDIAEPESGLSDIDVLQVRVTIVADATVATRSTHLLHEDAGGDDVADYGGIDATASQTQSVLHVLGSGGDATNTNGDAQRSMGNRVLIPNGHGLRVRVTNGQAGDVVTARALIRRRYYDVS